MLVPGLDQGSRCEGVFLFPPARLLRRRQVIFHRGCDDHLSRAAQSERLVEESAIGFKALIPPAPFPGDRPTLLAAPAADALDQHARFGDGPFAHALLALLVLRADRLDNDKAQPRLRVLLDLLRSER